MSKLIGYSVKVDMSNQIHQSRDSCIVIANNTLKYSVCLPQGVKHSVLSKKRFSNITDRIPKMHAIMIYLCIHKFLKEIAEMQICPDGTNKRTLNKYLLDFLLDEEEKTEYLRIKPKFKGVDAASLAHKYASRCLKDKTFDVILRLKDIEIIIIEMQERSSIKAESD